MTINNKNLGKIIKQQRVMAELSLQQLSAMSGVSLSHLGRIERGQRHPSASVLRKIAKALGLDEVELFFWAGYLSPQPSGSGRQLDPYVAAVLAREPVEVQRAVIGLLSTLKSVAKSVIKE